MINNILKDFNKLKNPDKAKILSSFFKTKKGEYGEGDVFLGITVPLVRNLVKKYYNECNFPMLKQLLPNKFHEIRLFALLVLTEKYKKNIDIEKIVNFYLENTSYINNWDLVDLSSSYILGNYCYNNQRTDILYKLSKSDNIWEKRIAIVSTHFYIKHNSFEPTIKIATNNLAIKHDLIQKATGWMLREIGKRDISVLLSFLDKHHLTMPRTMLRYSIEKLDNSKRLYYLKREGNEAKS